MKNPRSAERMFIVDELKLNHREAEKYFSHGKFGNILANMLHKFFSARMRAFWDVRKDRILADIGRDALGWASDFQREETLKSISEILQRKFYYPQFRENDHELHIENGNAGEQDDIRIEELQERERPIFLGDQEGRRKVGGG